MLGTIPQSFGRAKLGTMIPRVVSINVMGGRSNSHALQTSFTKRMSQRWQASGTYTLSVLNDLSGVPNDVLIVAT